jgi:hypothetical protein
MSPCRSGLPVLTSCRRSVGAPGTPNAAATPALLRISTTLDQQTPGDRAAQSRSSTEPIPMARCVAGGWTLIRRCPGCREIHLNRIARGDHPIPRLRRAVRLWAQLHFPFELPRRVRRRPSWRSSCWRLEATSLSRAGCVVMTRRYEEMRSGPGLNSK